MEWKQIQGFDNYLVSEYGDVKSNVRSRDKSIYYNMKLQNSNGYKIVMLIRNDGKKISMKVHRIVAIAFIENIDNLMIINHIDGNKKNNHTSNLEWCTYSHNNKHAFKMQLKVNAKSYTNEDEELIVSLRSKGLRAKDIQIRLPHLKVYVIQKVYEKHGLIRDKKDTSKFSIDEKIHIKKRLLTRVKTIDTISKELGINRRTAGRIINNTIWKEIQVT